MYKRQILFRPLGREDLRRIVDLQLVRVSRLARDAGVVLDVDAAARDRIVEEGYDPAFGARPLKRAIQRLIQDPLASYLLDEGMEPGAVVRVTVGGEDGELTFERGGT